MQGCGTSRPAGVAPAPPAEQKEEQSAAAANAVAQPPPEPEQPAKEEEPLFRMHQRKQRKQKDAAQQDEAPPPPLNDDEEELLLLLLRKKQQQQQREHQPQPGGQERQQEAQPMSDEQQQQQQEQQQQQQQGGEPEGQSRPPPPPPPPQPQQQFEDPEELQEQLDGQQVQEQLQEQLQGELAEMSQKHEQQLEGLSQQQEQKLQSQQQQLQTRLAGLTPDQVLLLQRKLHERLQQQLQNHLQQQKEQQGLVEQEWREQEAAQEQRQQQRQQRKEQREAQRGQLEQQYEQELLQQLLLPREGSDTEASRGSVSAGADGSGAPAPTRPAIPVKAWSGDSGDGSLLFPELDDLDFKVTGITRRAPLALCFGGGGFRAAMLGLGWLRALHLLGLLHKAQYMCACSGSSWLSALFFQQLERLEQFLGAHRPPEDCTLGALREVGDKGASLARAISDAAPLLGCLRSLFTGSLDGEEGVQAERMASTWAKAVTAAFLEPFGLGDSEDSAVTISGTKGDVHESVKKRATELGLTTHTANHLLPFPIICQSLLLPDDPTLYYPYEWTPLYGGCPVEYASAIPQLGGGWVEALGVNSELVSKPPTAAASGCEVRVRPAGPSSLGRTVGISSSANGHKMALDRAHRRRLQPQELGFNTAAYFDQQTWDTNRVAFADGGGGAYQALYPALRRRVSNIISFSSPRVAIGDRDEFSEATKELRAMFGRWSGIREPGGPSSDDYNKQRQVFPREAFDELQDALAAKVAAGEPALHVAKYEVVANRHVGVPGGWSVRVLWVVSQVQQRWEEALPADTRDRLERDRRGGSRGGGAVTDPDLLCDFPFLPTSATTNTSPAMVQLMANHAAWMLLQNRELVEAMAGGGDEDDDY